MIPWNHCHPPGVGGLRKFVDNSFSTGPDMVQYQVQAQRADRSGAVSLPLVVTFGVPGSGPTATSAAILGHVNGGQVTGTAQSNGNKGRLAA